MRLKYRWFGGKASEKVMVVDRHGVCFGMEIKK